VIALDMSSLAQMPAGQKEMAEHTQRMAQQKGMMATDQRTRRAAEADARVVRNDEQGAGCRYRSDGP
jgi:hypothetical protein